MTSLEFGIGTAIAVLMAIGFTRISSGRSLIVTFVPGVVISWLVTLWMFVQHVALPAADHFLPYFFTALIVQFLHFAEEFRTDFKTFFPVLYGGTAYSDNLFVTFNMAAYAVFTTCALSVFYLDARYLLMPALFFIVYGAIGNAISHTVWSATARAYRPGLITAQAYWIIGPLALYKLTGSAVATAVTCVGFAVVLLITLNIPVKRVRRQT
ncbi:HXXEE domain-containing protein [Mycobacterium sp. 852002-40037_SCH5390672]|uniref:HXXEE domain-containing protein n=1 Tax=Mycobacterium sp. 852002-40037_SCH5390672 TaxID=1834089 RepID=UPI000804958E|nr:HXXEE domain-containing protein [Mycobacterium sp. 852002-40037_SCH5390672]OBB96479.1 hypothetical protein A5782_04895 [Mycobacterium sp. 852002-40037_SCH5390672]